MEEARRWLSTEDQTELLREQSIGWLNNVVLIWQDCFKLFPYALHENGLCVNCHVVIYCRMSLTTFLTCLTSIWSLPCMISLVDLEDEVFPTYLIQKWSLSYLMWTFMSEAYWKSFPHLLHKYVSPVWILTCCFRWAIFSTCLLFNVQFLDHFCLDW